MLQAIASVPREVFVPPSLRARAYENVALPIGHGQTISQPLVVARMLELLAPMPFERALDIGTGSGYHAALLAMLCAFVDGIERDAALALGARAALERLGITNVRVHHGDGSLGLAEHAPFDLINIAAATETVPPALLEQLAPGGRLVVPLIQGTEQRLVLIRRTATGLRRSVLEPVRFVALVTGTSSR